MDEAFERYHPNMETLRHKFQTGPCFICQIVAQNPQFPAYIIYEDEHTIAFLDKYPRQYGYALVAPRAHLEQVTGFGMEGYLELQRLIYTLSEAIRQEVTAERIYIFTFGSNQGNAHVHWHIAPLPAGTPYEEQQMKAVSWRRGVLNVPETEMVDLAKRLGRRLMRERG